jgi:hypothetical protein
MFSSLYFAFGVCRSFQVVLTRLGHRGHGNQPEVLEIAICATKGGLQALLVPVYQLDAETKSTGFSTLTFI